MIARSRFLVVLVGTLFLAPLVRAAAPPITAIAFTPDHSAVVIGSQAGLKVRSWPALEPVETLPTELTNIHDLTFSPDGKTLVVVGGIPAEYGTVELFRWPDRELIRRFSPHDDLIYAVDWRSNSQAFALASGDQRMSLHAIASTESKQMLEGHSRGVLAVALLPDGKVLTAGVDATIRLWDTNDGTSLRTFTNHTRPINDLKRRPTNDSNALPMVASCSDDRTVRFWQPTIGRLVRFARLDSTPLAIAWTGDGRMLWAACRDGRVRAVNPENAAVEHDLPAIDGPAYSLAVASDGSLVVAGSNGQFRRVVAD